MKLTWTSCFSPFDYTGRKTRFAVTYTAFNGVVNITEALKKYFLFSENKEKRRVSFRLPEGATKRCQFASKLITDHPSASNFLTDFIKANPQIPESSIRYMVFDESGTDLPLVPSGSDLSSSTAFMEFGKFFGTWGIPALVIYGGYLYIKKRKRN